MTPLDQAHAEMTAAPDDDAARLRFFGYLADAELILLLEREGSVDLLAPRIFDLEDGPVALVFDTEDRLAEFCGAPAPYAALPGRVIAAQLAGKGIGLGLNLGVAISSMLLPPDALDWLTRTLGQPVLTGEDSPASFAVPQGMPDVLMQALATRLSRATGLASVAVLAGVTYRSGRRGHLLAFLDPIIGAEEALARMVAEALTFSGLDAGEMDVVFLRGSDRASDAMLACGLRLEMAASAPTKVPPSVAPGLDPARPPILR
jgi:hypothetical protein